MVIRQNDMNLRERCIGLQSHSFGGGVGVIFSYESEVCAKQGTPGI